MATLNAILAVLLYSLLIRNGVGRLMSVLLVLTNYYFWVVAIPAERLKIAIIFTACFYLIKISALRLLFFVLAILSHASVILLFVPFFCNLLKAKFFNRQEVFFKFGAFIAIIIVIYFIGDGVLSKFFWITKGVYSKFSEVLPTLLLGALSLYFSRHAIFATGSSFLIISFLIIFLSADRLNMFSLLISIGYIIDGKPKRFQFKFLQCDFRDLVLIFFLIAMTAKSMAFFLKIYYYGHGFGVIENTC
jgi:hypothetical protein